jgi:hypothetical protein
MTQRTMASIVVFALAAGAAIGGGTYLARRTEARSAGAYTPTATIKDLMDAIVDPSADDVWNAVSTTVGPEGTNDKVPRTDEEWTAARRGAIRLVEGANLLMMPGRHVARPGEKSETPGVELEPGEMEALVNADRGAWEKRVQTFHTAGLEMLHAIDARDTVKLCELGSTLDTACENCHRQYWYPNEKIPEFPKELSTETPNPQETARP